LKFRHTHISDTWRHTWYNLSWNRLSYHVISTVELDLYTGRSETGTKLGMKLYNIYPFWHIGHIDVSVW